MKKKELNENQLSIIKQIKSGAFKNSLFFIEITDMEDRFYCHFPKELRGKKYRRAKLIIEQLKKSRILWKKYE